MEISTIYIITLYFFIVLKKCKCVAKNFIEIMCLVNLVFLEVIEIPMEIALNSSYMTSICMMLSWILLLIITSIQFGMQLK